MTILIIHYHLRAGGVTRVINSQARVLRQMGHRVIIASSGPCDQSEEDHLLVPELDYQTEGKIPVERLHSANANLWIIHNPTLGLNVAYPAMIESAVESGTRILMQIHDFVEDGRPTNYQLLAGIKRLYPSAPHVHYATINRRDLAIIQNAGIPETRCHFLPNAVNPPAINSTSPTETLVFYPVRGIRRKNLGEICLLAAHAPPGTRFAVALRAGAEDPAFLHDEWVEFAREHNLPVSFDVVGKEPGSFTSWLEKSTHLVTTSISEGFGLTFLDPAILKKPLIGRDLPEITCDFVPFGRLYQKIPISLEHLPNLKDQFFNQVKATMATYGCLLEDKQLEKAWRHYSANDEVDFGNLPEEFQRRIIAKVKLPSLSDWLLHALEQPAQEVDTSPWTLATYSKTLAETINAIGEPGPINWIPRNRILVQFLKPERFHFLRACLPTRPLELEKNQPC